MSLPGPRLRVRTLLPRPGQALRSRLLPKIAIAQPTQSREDTGIYI